MSVDRAARDRLASALAAYLRSEVDNFAVHDAGLGAPWTDDATLRCVRSGVWLSYDDLKSHSVSATPEAWEALRRTIAFLRSDLEFRTPGARNRWQPRQSIGLAALIFLSTSIYLAFTQSTAWLLLPGLTIGLPMLVWCLVSDRGNDDADQSLYFPFRDEQQWRRYERLLDAERLPPYDPARHRRPIRSRLTGLVIGIPGYLLAPFVALPLLAILMLLPRGDAGVAEERA